MDEKPELVVFSQNLIGGVQSYYYNLLSHDSMNSFDKLWILTDLATTKDARLKEPFNCCKEIVFTYQPDRHFKTADELQKLISNRPGVVLVNHELELVTLHKYRRKNKTILFVCHDELYFDCAWKYEFLIDAYITHNTFFFSELKKRIPSSRSKDVYYLPYGIKPADSSRSKNLTNPLRVLFVARLTEKKGIFDLKKIDDELLKEKVTVEWTIVGDGPEKDRLKEDLSGRENFSFHSPLRNEEILAIAKKNDVFILPSYLDGLPVALLETMSAGLVPVVSRFNPGVESVVEADNGFIVPVSDVAGFAEKIKFLNDNREELELRSLKSREKILKEYEVESRARAYYTFFNGYSQLKKPFAFSRVKYDKTLDYPWIPQFIRQLRYVLQ